MDEKMIQGGEGDGYVEARFVPTHEIQWQGPGGPEPVMVTRDKVLAMVMRSNPEPELAVIFYRKNGAWWMPLDGTEDQMVDLPRMRKIRS